MLLFLTTTTTTVNLLAQTTLMPVLFVNALPGYFKTTTRQIARSFGSFHPGWVEPVPPVTQKPYGVMMLYLNRWMIFKLMGMTSTAFFMLMYKKLEGLLIVERAPLFPHFCYKQLNAQLNAHN